MKCMVKNVMCQLLVKQVMDGVCGQRGFWTKWVVKKVFDEVHCPKGSG